MKNLLKFLFGHAPLLVITAVLTSIVSGLANTALLALIREGIDAQGEATHLLIWGFAGSMVLLLVSRIVAQVLLVNLSEKTIYELRLHLARRIMAAPLRSLERFGANKLLTALTDDVTSLSNTLGMIPMFFMHAAIVTSIFGYLFWLHWPVYCS